MATSSGDGASFQLVPLSLRQRPEYHPISEGNRPSSDMPPMRPRSPWTSTPTWPRRPRRTIAFLISSYVFDWIVIIIALAVSFVLGNITPNKRPFSVEDPNISFPYTEKETVPSWLLVTCNAAVPIVLVLIIALVLVPGNTVPPGTPQSLIWKRKLWELHAGWQGLALSLASAWLITNGMKNLFGKPRPDLLSRCNPDIQDFTQHIVGGVNVGSGFQQLVSASICQGRDGIDLDDGFRSFPSGHASSSAAGLIYLSLFIASKFAITFPFLTPAGYGNESSFSAFPSRLPRAAATLRANLEPEVHGPRLSSSTAAADGDLESQQPNRLANHGDPSTAARLAQHNMTVAAVRRQAAAPPIYLLVFAVVPFFAAIFIASSRWFDFRHHGFDIMFGFLIGTVTALFAFRWYHLPVSQGAGWAWGPRSPDKAWWAGVGSFSYATDRQRYPAVRPGDEEESIEEGSGKEQGQGHHHRQAHAHATQATGTNVVKNREGLAIA